MKKNILVTGGGGFIGTEVCKILLQKGHTKAYSSKILIAYKFQKPTKT